MSYTILFKKLMRGETINKKDYGILKDLTEKDIQDIQTVYKKLKEKAEPTKEKEAEIPKVLEENNLTGRGFNRQVYEQLLPLTRLACRLENNEGAELHAAKLAILFGTTEGALAYLERFEQENPARSQLIHDACLFSIPEGDWDVKLWQEIVRKNMPDKKLEKVLPFAKKIEDYVRKNRSELETKVTQEVKRNYELELSLKYDREEQPKSKKSETPPKDHAEKKSKKTAGVNAKEVEREFREYLLKKYEHALPSKKGKLTKEAQDRLRDLYKKLSDDDRKKKEEITAQMSKKLQEEPEKARQEASPSINASKNQIIEQWLKRDERRIDAACATARHRILDGFTSPTTLLAYVQNIAYTRANENPEAARLFFENGISESAFNKYLGIKIAADNPAQIPDIVMNGSDIGYPGFYIKKLNRRDPRAAILGKLTSCCQSLGAQGEACAIDGITNPNAGFYVLCQQEGANVAETDPIYAQCWAWRGSRGNLVFDSIESQINFRQHGNNRVMIGDMYTYFAHQLVSTTSVPQVLVGDRSLTSSDLGLMSPREPESPIRYTGHRDSWTQRVVADRNLPLVALYVHFAKVSKEFSDRIRNKEKVNFEIDKKSFEAAGLDINKSLLPVTQIGNLTLIKYLVERKADLNETDFNGDTALLLAVRRGYIDIGKYLVEHKADLNARDRKGYTALLLAAADGHIDMVKCLVEHKADLNATHGSGNTALLLAAGGGHIDVVKYLVEEQGANLNAKNDYEKTAFLSAAAGGHIDVMKYLVAHKVDVNAIDLQGKTALLLAAEGGHIDVVKYLVEEQGADLNVRDSYDDNTALLLAIRGGHVNVVKYLVAHKADVNTMDSYGNTALLLAAEGSHIDMVKYLVEEQRVDLTEAVFSFRVSNDKVKKYLQKVKEEREKTKSLHFQYQKTMGSETTDSGLSKEEAKKKGSTPPPLG